MKKILIGLLTFGLSFSVLAETDYIANGRVDNIRNGTTKKSDRINTLYVHGESTFNAGISASGSGELILNSDVVVSNQSLTITGSGGLGGSVELNGGGVPGISFYSNIDSNTAYLIYHAPAGALFDGIFAFTNGHTYIYGGLAVAGHQAYRISTQQVVDGDAIIPTNYLIGVVGPTNAAAITNVFANYTNIASLVGSSPRNEIHNLGTNTIFFEDTGNLNSAGKISIGPEDSFIIQWFATNDARQVGGVTDI
jgi:hypothetical protein